MQITLVSALVAEDQRQLRVVELSILYVEVCSAHPACLHTHEHLAQSGLVVGVILRAEGVCGLSRIIALMLAFK
jgi:hypothetical protein